MNSNTLKKLFCGSLAGALTLSLVSCNPIDKLYEAVGIGNSNEPSLIEVSPIADIEIPTDTPDIFSQDTDNQDIDNSDIDNPDNPDDIDNPDITDTPDIEKDTDTNDEPKETASEADLSMYTANTEVLKIQKGDTDYSDYDLIKTRFAYASSWNESEENYSRYSAENMFDGDLATAYVEGAEGDGIGEIIEILFADLGTCEVDKIKVYPGYQKSKETFQNNSRPTKLSFYFPDGHRFTQEFDYGNETSGYFEIDLKKVFAGTVVADGCVITIDDASTGDKFEDCCISEIEFYAPKKPDKDAILVSYESEYFNGTGEKCVISAFQDGKKIWEYTCKTEQVTELEGAQYITTANGIVFAQDDWQIIALDAKTGNVIWKGDYEGGFSVSGFTYDVVTGNLYASGYYGPDIIAYDKNGNELFYDNMEVAWPEVMIPDISDAPCGIKEGGFDSVRILFNQDSSIVTYNVK